MSGIRHLFFAALFLFIGVSLHAQNPAAPTPPKPPELTAEAKIEAALLRKVSLDVTDEPLHEAMGKLATQTQITIVISRKIEDAGVMRDQPVTVALKEISLQSLLRIMLSDLNLTFMLKDEVLKITTVEDAQSPENLQTRVYAVKDLVLTGKKTPSGEAEVDFGPLIELITSNVEPDVWPDVGGPGSIHEFAQSTALVVSNRREVHERIERLLATLRKTRDLQTVAARPTTAGNGTNAPAIPVYVAAVRDQENQSRIEAALGKSISYAFEDVPLKDVLANIGKDLKLQILLTKKIEDAGVSPDMPVTIALEKVSLRSYLNILLGERNLTFIIADEVVKVTTVEDAMLPENMVTRVYPVRDLVEWPAKVVGARPELDFGPLSDMIMSCIEPDTWGDGQQTLPSEKNSAVLVIFQREEIHERIADLLTQLRKTKSAQGLDRPADVTPKLPAPPTTRPVTPR